MHALLLALKMAVTLAAALETPHDCPIGSVTSWQENLGYSADKSKSKAGPYVYRCGDDLGHRIDVPETPAQQCEHLADLHYEIALSAGVDADGAWEDAFAACSEEL